MEKLQQHDVLVCVYKNTFDFGRGKGVRITLNLFFDDESTSLAQLEEMCLDKLRNRGWQVEHIEVMEVR